MSLGDDDFDDNSITACIALHLDMQIGYRFQQTVVIGPHTVVTDVMAIPGLAMGGANNETPGQATPPNAFSLL